MNDLFDKVLLDLMKARYDTTPTKNEPYAKQLMAVHREFVKRNQKLTGLLENYIDNKDKRTKENKTCKRIIFGVFVGIFLALTITLIIVFLKVDINNADTESIVSLATVAVTYIGSILTIIKIISQYLFPIDEEKDTIEMIKAVIQNDVQVEDMMSKAIDKSDSVDFEIIKNFYELLKLNIITVEEFEKIKSHYLHFINTKDS